MSKPTNEGRAEIAMRALVAVEFSTMCREDLESSIVDLVADLLHLARERDIEPDYIIHTATMHFDAEVEEEALNAVRLIAAAPKMLKSLKSARLMLYAWRSSRNGRPHPELDREILEIETVIAQGRGQA